MLIRCDPAFHRSRVRAAVRRAGASAPRCRAREGLRTAELPDLKRDLAALPELVHERSLEDVMPLGTRHAEALGQKPGVASVVIARLDKSNGAAG